MLDQIGLRGQLAAGRAQEPCRARYVPDRTVNHGQSGTVTSPAKIRPVARSCSSETLPHPSDPVPELRSSGPSHIRWPPDTSSCISPSWPTAERAMPRRRPSALRGELPVRVLVRRRYPAIDRLSGSCTADLRRLERTRFWPEATAEAFWHWKTLAHGPSDKLQTRSRGLAAASLSADATPTTSAIASKPCFTRFPRRAHVSSVPSCGLSATRSSREPRSSASAALTRHGGETGSRCSVRGGPADEGPRPVRRSGPFVACPNYKDVACSSGDMKHVLQE